MKIGLLTALLSDRPLDDVLDVAADLGVEAVELGCGAYPGDAHCPADALLSSRRRRDEFLAKIRGRGLVISALSCHGNPLHPNASVARAHHQAFVRAVKLAGLLGVRVVNTFSGCPGGSPGARCPNWVTCPWPDEFLEVLDWQWQKRVLPYWKRQAARVGKVGVRVALEMHPGFVVYNPETLLRLREACGKWLGANFDPSHLFWQGIDPLVALKELAGAVFHVHAKDCRLEPQNVARNGVLDTKHYGEVAARSWVFRTVGYGHPESFWRDFVSTLRVTGYDGVLSIEHEDSLASVSEGLRRAVELLRRVVLTEKPGGMWWA